MFSLNNLNQDVIKINAKICRERGIIIPTFEELKYPHLIDNEIIKKLTEIGLWDINPLNLFRVTWKNQPIPSGGGYTSVNYIEIPQELTNVRAKIIALVGKWFPTGSHKVGATFGCLVPYLITGRFNAAENKAVWPSTGNYCRGGAYISSLLACSSIAILPEEMSVERFQWLSKVAGEVIATPGCESNVKEIFDKCRELKEERTDIVVFNQFDQFGNYLWHYTVTGSAIEEIIGPFVKDGLKFSGLVLSSGSSGTLGSADYLKKVFPLMKLGVGEALQCPTLLLNGFGGHRIEGIGDKHVPWIHNLRNTDMIIAIDDEQSIRLLRLFNEDEGKKYLKKNNIPMSFIDKLDLLGISSIGNLLAAIKFANYYELTEDDIVVTVFTDSFELYPSRIKELNENRGKYRKSDSIKDFEMLKNIKEDNVLELSYYEKKRIHNLKYFTWIEQQNKRIEELNRQWYDYENYWGNVQNKVEKIDSLINEFNTIVRLL